MNIVREAVVIAVSLLLLYLLHICRSCQLSVVMGSGVYVSVGTYTRDPNEVFDFLTSLISQAKRKGNVLYNVPLILFIGS